MSRAQHLPGVSHTCIFYKIAQVQYQSLGVASGSLIGMLERRKAITITA